MKSPILILFIILNLLAINVASAMNMFEEELSESHLVHSHDMADATEQASLDTISASCLDESACSHFCHITSHMMGYLSQVISISIISSSIVVLTQDDALYSLIQEPPFLPPRTA